MRFVECKKMKNAMKTSRCVRYKTRNWTIISVGYWGAHHQSVTSPMRPRGRWPSAARSCNRSDDATRLDSDRRPNPMPITPVFRWPPLTFGSRNKGVRQVLCRVHLGARVPTTKIKWRLYAHTRSRQCAAHRELSPAVSPPAMLDIHNIIFHITSYSHSLFLGMSYDCRLSRDAQNSHLHCRLNTSQLRH